MVASNFEFKRISINDVEQIELFLNNSIEVRKSFRYFEHRPISIICNHLVTVLIYLNDIPVGYGHLDKENNTVWLGIAINEAYQGIGLGNRMMKYLIDVASEYKVKTISLTVDKDNSTAIYLYQKIGFIKQKYITNHTLLMVLNLK